MSINSSIKLLIMEYEDKAKYYEHCYKKLDSESITNSFRELYLAYRGIVIDLKRLLNDNKLNAKKTSVKRIRRRY